MQTTDYFIMQRNLMINVPRLTSQTRLDSGQSVVFAYRYVIRPCGRCIYLASVAQPVSCVNNCRIVFFISIRPCITLFIIFFLVIACVVRILRNVVLLIQFSLFGIFRIPFFPIVFFAKSIGSVLFHAANNQANSSRSHFRTAPRRPACACK